MPSEAYPVLLSRAKKERTAAPIRLPAIYSCDADGARPKWRVLEATQGIAQLLWGA
jgi:hypothetical protein